MTDDLQQFHHDFFQEVLRGADADGRWSEDAFFELFCDQLVEAGELETRDRARYVARSGIRIDGYGGDPATTEGTLSLIVLDFNQSPDIETLTATEMDAAFKRARNFLSKSLERTFRNSLEETTPGFGLATLIADTWSLVGKVRIFLVTNRVLSSRIDSVPEGQLDGRPIACSVWDLGRLQRYMKSGAAREEMVVNLREHGGSVPALRAHFSEAGYEAYLIVLPGSQLASIYGRWGARLLEQNVRVFLQARGNVNKGIRNTIENDPEMFFAYNNGITATAEEVIGKTDGNGLTVSSLRNLQIVNGGQTTASIYAASQKKDVDLARVFVQMKLSVIPAERAEGVVPKISEYANSQNRVNAADFFANHPFHLRFKGFSETLFAPSQDGTLRESRWFYERARGQYQDARGGLTTSAQKKFDLEYPKKQVVTKTDLAKFMLAWESMPHIVSLGAQKNFAYFAGKIGKEWATNPDQFGEQYFRDAISKAIVFRETETLVSNQPWYTGGIRANIVAYAISKLAHDVKRFGKGIDLAIVWRSQAITAPLREALTVAADVVRLVIGDPPPGAGTNLTEWAKREACWNRVEALSVSWPPSLRAALLDWEELKEREKDGKKDQKLLNGIEAQTFVVNAGAKVWRQVLEWAREHKVLSQKEIEILGVATEMPAKLPSERQCFLILKALSKARSEGCPFGPERS